MHEAREAIKVDDGQEVMLYEAGAEALLACGAAQLLL